MRLKDRVAIVTGAAKGIGWGIAKVLSQEGAKVVVVDWDAAEGEKSAEEIRKAGGDALFVNCDVSNEEQVKAMIQAALDKYGQIDILVNNAGIGVYMSVTDATSADWDRCLGVNLKGVFLCSKYAIPHMQKLGNVPQDEMLRTFNMGLGMLLVVPAKKFKKAQTLLERAGEKFYTVGRIVKGERKVLYS